jgi:8-oxo-dGTP pyrophosphatase MutT (NUDIX family)
VDGVASEHVPAAVLVPLFAHGDELHVVLTKRRADLRRHAGEISFPGGRTELEDEDLEQTALREAREEIGLPPGEVSVLGRLAPVSTFVTGYLIHPFVGLIPRSRSWTLSPHEVDAVIELPLDEVRTSRTRATLERRGFAFETDAYVIDQHLIWGATARIIENLLERLAPLLDRAG